MSKQNLVNPTMTLEAQNRHLEAENIRLKRFIEIEKNRYIYKKK
ncbi:MAG: hypothetical protein PVI06_10730 [Desulfobacterales bacterium]